MTSFAQHATAAFAAALIMVSSFGAVITVPQESGQVIVAAPALA